MTKEKLSKLTVYLSNMKDKLSAKTPSKHEGHPDTYRRFLQNEIATVSKQLEEALLEGVAKK